MKKTILSIAFLGLLLPLCAMQHLPVELNFSDSAERAQWQFMNLRDTIPTSWVIGYNPDYSYGSDYMMYLSNDSGVTRTYDINANSYTCMAYYPLDTLPYGTYTLSFRYRGISSNQNTYVYVSVTTSPPSSAPAYRDNPYYYSGSYKYYYGYYSETVMGKWWSTRSTSFTSDGGRPCYICFTFYYQSNADLPDYPNPGYAIDGIQIYPSPNYPTCAQRPLNFSMSRSANDINLSWDGNASEYQLEYFMNDTTLNTHYRVNNITSRSYTLHSEQIPEGAYTFRVRAICGKDTSGWNTYGDYQLVYDISKHCMDYLNFDHPDVKAHSGSFSNPNSGTGVINKGFTSEDSRHTIHHYPRDYDERTNYQLRTFPEGQPAAIRLGNWKTKSQAENIVYTMQVTEDMSIMKLRYALVMQLPNHNALQQPRFTLEFLDSVGVLIDSCGYVDFTASADLEGWHTEHTEGKDDIIWKDWSLIGLNMQDYIGSTVQVRITTKDCSEGKHFGYAYFTMSCSDNRIQGIHCGVKPEHFTVEDGFYYRWYHKYDSTRTVLGRERTFNLTDPMDTATYCVDMINMIKPDCYFTMEASSLAYLPHSAGGIRYIPSDCKNNNIQLIDSSTIQGVYWEPDGSKVVVRETPGVDEFHWDLGPYGISTEHSPVIPISNAGDTLHVKLYTYMDNHECEDTLMFDYVVPALGPSRTIDTYYFCSGGSITHAGNTYTAETDLADTLVGSNGCDSISIVALRYFQMDTIVVYDTLCAGTTMEWYGQTLSEAGEYFSPVPSKVYDCDSAYNLLYLHKQPYLSMTMDYTQQHVCGSGGTIEVPFSVTAGDVRTYDLLFSDAAKEYGYTDRLAQKVAPAASELLIALSGSLQPGVYDASIVFHNMHCDSMTFPVTFAVYYDPDSLITQRWNDFLSVRKSAFDAYGGFSDYQWYKDDQPIAGQTGSQLYVPEEGLDPASTYSVELTRVSDGVRLRTCPYHPTLQPSTVTITVYPTVVSSQNPAPLHVQTSRPAQIRLYGEDGVLRNTWNVPEGTSQLEAPAAQGLYLLHVLTQSGEQTVRKIIVK